jgi:polyisoprenoid-binding protein YceI
MTMFTYVLSSKFLRAGAPIIWTRISGLCLLAMSLQASVKYEAPEATPKIYKISTSKNVVMSLSGTTPLKNWTMFARGLSGSAQMSVSKENQLSEIRSLDFSLPVLNLKGEHPAMDEDAYTALKANKYKEIVFKLVSAEITRIGEHEYKVAALGTLSVAGVTRTVTLQMRSVVASDGSLTFTGSEKLRMSDYDVERPSLLFGTIKAGDNMTLTYTLIFTRQCAAS